MCETCAFNTNYINQIHQQITKKAHYSRYNDGGLDTHKENQKVSAAESLPTNPGLRCLWSTKYCFYLAAIITKVVPIISIASIICTNWVSDPNHTVYYMTPNEPNMWRFYPLHADSDVSSYFCSGFVSFFIRTKLETHPWTPDQTPSLPPDNYPSAARSQQSLRLCASQLVLLQQENLIASLICAIQFQVFTSGIHTSTNMSCGIYFWLFKGEIQTMTDIFFAAGLFEP